jgi:protein archease
MTRYEVLSHTADTGIRTTGPDLGAVIANAAFAMFELMYDLASVPGGATVTFEVDRSPPDELLVGVLSELLFRSETQGVVFTDVTIEVEDDPVVVTATAHPSQRLEATGPPVKAVTYHELRCEQTDDGWLAQVIFDV